MDLIIGAGITGLSYAASSDNDYLIIERDSSVGGYCRTIKQDGFIWDYSGHFFHFQDEAIKDYVFSNLKKDEIISVVKSTQIYHHGILVDFPFQKNIHQLNKEELISCLYDLFAKRPESYTNFKEMLYSKFGKSISDLFLIPYNEKLYACDLNKLDVDAMGRFFPYADKEEIIANFKQSENRSYNAKFVYPKGGAIEYVNSVLQQVNKNKIHLNESIIGIDMQKHLAFTNKEVIQYNNLISTMPFPKLLDICHIQYDKNIYTSNKVLVFNIGFDKAGSRTNHWEYFADKNLVFYRVGFYNNIFGTDKLSVYVEIGLAENSDYDEIAFFNRTISDLKKVGIIDSHEVESYCSILMDPAYVHVTKRMEADRFAKMRKLAKMDIYSIGRYGAWYYCSIEDNIKEAFNLSRKLCLNKK